MHHDLNDKQIQYVWWDFHGECKKMQWNNISKLVNIVDDKLKGYNFFIANVVKTFEDRQAMTQTGAFKIVEL